MCIGQQKSEARRIVYRGNFEAEAACRHKHSIACGDIYIDKTIEVCRRRAGKPATIEQQPAGQCFARSLQCRQRQRVAIDIAKCTDRDGQIDRLIFQRKCICQRHQQGRRIVDGIDGKTEIGRACDAAVTGRNADVERSIKVQWRRSLQASTCKTQPAWQRVAIGQRNRVGQRITIGIDKHVRRDQDIDRAVFSDCNGIECALQRRRIIDGIDRQAEHIASRQRAVGRSDYDVQRPVEILRWLAEEAAVGEI